MLRIKGCYYDISVVNIHTPSDEKDDSFKTAFYSKLERTIDKLPKFDETCYRRPTHNWYIVSF